MSSQNFSIIGVVARELHLLEVKGVENVFFFLKFGQNSFVLRHNS
jgi:hypothetical protein